MDKIDRSKLIIDELRSKGYRITNQRQLLIGIILENECSSCKEIYYKAIKEDPTVGIATVYRIVKTLEDLGVINRKNLYNIAYENLNTQTDHSVLLVSGDSGEVVELKKGNWFNQLETELRLNGLIDNHNISIVIKKNEVKNKEGEDDDQLYYSCRCDNDSCVYNRKKHNAS